MADYVEFILDSDKEIQKVELPAGFIFKNCWDCRDRQKNSHRPLWPCSDCQQNDQDICTCKDDRKCQLCIQIECFKTDQINWMRCFLRDELSEFKYVYCSSCLRLREQNPDQADLCSDCKMGHHGMCFTFTDGRRYEIRCNKCRFCLQYNEHLRQEEKRDRYYTF